MDSVDSSPNFTKARSRFDPNKENSPGGSESDEIMSVSSSNCGSSVTQSHSQKLSNNGIKNRATTSNKTPKNYATVRSFRRRPKPRLIQSPLPLSDDDEASPHYLKATTSSQGKKSRSSESTLDGSDSKNTSHSSFLSRKSSFRNVRVLIKRASFKPKRSLLRDVGVERATYSSTLKDSKFPSPAELQLDHCREEESEKSSALKVCRYHHCSLHGGCHTSGEPAPPLKRFLYKRKQSLRKKRSMMPKAETTRGVKLPSDRKKNLHKRVIAREVEPLDRERFSEDIAVSGVVNRNNPNEETELFGNGYSDVQEAYLVELAFGEMSFPERSYQDSLEIARKYSSEGQGLGGASLRCSCHNREDFMATPKRLEATATSIDWKNDKDASAEVLDTSIDNVAVSGKDGPDTPVVSDEKTKKRNAFLSASSGSNSSEEDAEFTTESSPAKENQIADDAAHVGDSEMTAPTHNKGGLHFSKPRHMSMWNLIHQHMSSNVSVESTDKDSVGAAASDSEAQEVEIRKMFAVKLVREAIEKILLPEVQDQVSDDQSVTSETTPRPELEEKDKSRAFIQENDMESAKGNESSDLKEETAVAGDVEVRKSEKKAPKHWSNLKKWILLQKFIRELEKVRRFNPKKPQHLPLNPDPETEKVSLRPQTVEERKSAEEWMLDHALRQAVSQLAPTQKKKVALLVKAFETVVPPQEDDSQAQCRIPRLKSVSIFDSAINGLRRAGLSGGDLLSSDENEKLEDLVHEENDENILKSQSLNLGGDDGDRMPVQVMSDETKTKTDAMQGPQQDAISDRIKHIKMWHMIYQHVVSDIAEKVGGHLLDGGEDEQEEDHATSSNLRGGLTKSDALKLVKQAVDEILVPEAQDEASDTRSVSSDSVEAEVGGDEELRVESKAEVPISRNWSKLKKLLLLKRSIKALRGFKPWAHQALPQTGEPEPEKVDLRQQMMDERKKAEQWMLDYAVQHIVTTLTPARKRRVAMLVEAFEAVVPLPEA
ncbi:calmodulin binding protein PICBP-like [Salvia hispanica]|uniref:calmodulin binding protein PICBP-like n=1 Tax=Salvia hispanica TaxID=49212 RepID=UPI00200947ED|nr:calmodulin binding protein PICBP-like [Salvia hispanica]XP_047942002.1 calmodulin binding protein PICBP-like [Salvia hispanica]XP_047942003.1 calmodulin binding protein PICBP-like [Salvia hispanica]